jgi:hypothetical protein
VRSAALPFVALALVLEGCVATATVTTRAGSVEAVINGGDDESLAVTNEVGARRRIRRDDIVDIDHPGNVLATAFGISTVLLAFDTVILATGPVCHGGATGSGAGPCIAIGSMAAASVGLFALGMYQWITSRNAVLGPPPPDVDMTKVPFAFTRQREPPPLPPLPPPEAAPPVPPPPPPPPP